MIPYFQYTLFYLGPVPIQVWGLMVALGMMAGVYLMYFLCKKDGFRVDFIFDLAVWIIVSALFFSRVFHVVFYNWSYYVEQPGEILKIWHGGLSSLGGFFGAALATVIFLKIKKITFEMFLPYADRGILGLWLGWGIGRVGCFLIHDHPGTLSHFILAVKYPNGVRHDLGLYESLTGFSLFIIFFIVYKLYPNLKKGLVVTISIAGYAIVRFCTDFLRTVDVRYARLTPAQWGMVGILIILTICTVLSTVNNSRLKSVAK
jgi:phosphatidylglycerol:prolipoprotein diacylglycerol transferase